MKAAWLVYKLLLTMLPLPQQSVYLVVRKTGNISAPR